MILVIIAMILNILNFGYSNISFDFWLSFCSTIVLIAAIVKIIIKEKKKSTSD